MNIAYEKIKNMNEIQLRELKNKLGSYENVKSIINDIHNKNKEAK